LSRHIHEAHDDADPAITGTHLHFQKIIGKTLPGATLKKRVQDRLHEASGLPLYPIGSQPVRPVRNDGTGKIPFADQRGSALIWRSMFEGQHTTVVVKGAK
jgi:hypothetical protein